jgi:hypothetical protein
MIILAFLLSSFTCHGYSGHPQITEADSNVLFVIDFRDSFDGDKLSMKINGCFVFKDKVLVSEKSTAYTNFEVKGYLKGNKQLIVVFRDGETHCVYRDNIITLDLVLNGKPLEYKINLLKGKYIGASKSLNNNLQWSQSQRPFQYD